MYNFVTLVLFHVMSFVMLCHVIWGCVVSCHVHWTVYVQVESKAKNQHFFEILLVLKIGLGPAAYFYVGKHGTEIQNANTIGIKIPYPENSNGKLRGFRSETIKIKLPSEIRFQVKFSMTSKYYRLEIFLF